MVNSISDRTYLLFRKLQGLTFCFLAGVALSAYLLVAMIAHFNQQPVTSIEGVIQVFMYFILPMGLALTAGIISMRRRCRLVCRRSA